MRIYTRAGPIGLRSGLLGLLLAAIDAESADIWLITPWLRDVDLPIGEQGHFVSVLGGQRDTVRLAELLLRLARAHRVHVVTKPFDELVPLVRVRRIGELLDDRDALSSDPEAREYESVERALITLGDEISALASEVTRHAEMVALLQSLSEQGIEVYVLPNLHAKLLWTPAGAMLGSANFTYAGVGHNEELMVEVSDPRHLADLRAAAAEFAERGMRLADDSIRPALARALLSPAEFRRLGDRLGAEPALSELASLVSVLADHGDLSGRRWPAPAETRWRSANAC